MSMTPEDKDSHLYDNAEILASQGDTMYSSLGSQDSGVNSTLLDPEEKAKQEEEWRSELAKVEEEIKTLRTVLSTKVKQAQELKHKLGITPLQEWQRDIQSGLKTVTDSEAYQKTTSGLKVAGEKTTETLSVLGTTVSKKMGDLKNTAAYKSFEEKVGSAYTNVKAKVIGNPESTGHPDATTNDVNNELDIRQQTQSAPVTPMTDEPKQIK